VSPTAADLDTALARFAGRVPGVQHALVVGADGLLSGSSPNLPRDRADAMAAITSGLVSLAARSARLFDGGSVSLTMLETHGGYMFLMPGTTSALVVWADHSCDVGQVGYELAILADSINNAGPPPGRF
jgi:predicted regulator of Ras-like GTPase activity (Roadblock/LC7/MglB family)